MALEDLSGKVSDLAQTGVAKAKELIDVGVTVTKEIAEIGKMKVENATEQEAIKKAYLEIGKLYFAERGMAPEAPYTALCEKIAASKAKIEYNLERIADIKAASSAAETSSESDIADDIEVEVACEECECGCETEASAETDAPAEPEAPAAPEAEDDAAEE